jgi:putative transposase
MVCGLGGAPQTDGYSSAVNAGELQLTGPGGFLSGLIRQVLERGLEIELSDHVGYEHGNPVGRGSPNKRNGSTPKTVLTEVGPLPLDVPRDRNSTFEPRLVPRAPAGSAAASTT